MELLFGASANVVRLSRRLRARARSRLWAHLAGADDAGERNRALERGGREGHETESHQEIQEDHRERNEWRCQWVGLGRGGM